MKDVVIFDIDGTIANCEHRLHFIKGKKKDFNRFYAHAPFDTPIRDVLEMVEVLAKQGYRIVFCTGRDESIQAITKMWIEYHLPYIDYDLYMRPHGNHSPDWMVKIETIKKAGISPDDVFAVFEDRQQVVEAWRDNGYRCYQVVKGDY